MKRTVTIEGPSHSSTKFKRQRKSPRVPRPMTAVLAAEVKYQDTQVSNASVTTTAQIVTLSNIAQGDQYNNRNGNQILAKYVQYNAAFLAITGTPSIGVLYVVLDRQANGGQANYASIFDTGTIGAPYSMKNIFSYGERFKILAHHQVSIAAGTDSNSIIGYIDMTKQKLADRVVKYPGSTATDSSTNNMLIVYMSNTASAGVVGFQAGFRYAFNEV